MSPATVPSMPPPKKEPTEQIRLPQSLVRKIRRVAGHRDLSPTDYLVGILEPKVDADNIQMMNELRQEYPDAAEPHAKEPRKR